MPYTRTRSKNIPVSGYLLFTVFLFLCIPQNRLHAQQSLLSIQGILKKANGDAVVDGNYDLTFKLYTAETGGTPIWTENQMDVEVTSGIYSTVLGNSDTLDVPFNQPYYLGITVGSGVNEMTPRIQLTSAPYALSLIGINNKFPSTGQVIADSIDVNGNVLTQSGAPGTNGSNRNGYGFLGDKDSGLYSTAAGEVSLYVNNAEIVEVKPALVDIKTDATVDNLKLKAEGKISYNGQNDWRLVEVDYMESSAEDWKVYNPLPGGPPSGGVGTAWKNGTGTAATVTSFTDDFAGKAMMPTAQGQVFKKQFTLPGSNVAGTYTHVKVVFNYYFLNSWDGNDADLGWAALSKTENCTELSVGWVSGHTFYASAGHNLGSGNAGEGTFGPAANFVTGSAQAPGQWSDQWRTEQMVARYPSGAGNTNFWVIFGHAANELVDAENFAVGMIEIWVK